MTTFRERLKSAFAKHRFRICPSCGTPDEQITIIERGPYGYKLMKCIYCKSEFIENACSWDGIFNRIFYVLNIPPFPKEYVWLCPNCGHPDQLGFCGVENALHCKWCGADFNLLDCAEYLRCTDLHCKWCGADFNRYSMILDSRWKRFVRWVTGKHYWGLDWPPKK